MKNPRVEELMKALDISEAEALQLIADDEEVDRMTVKQAESDLSAEQQANAKKSRQAERKKPTTPVKRERKENADKQHLIGMIKVLLEGLHCAVTVTNKERQLDFEYKGVKYRIVLSAPRS